MALRLIHTRSGVEESGDAFHEYRVVENNRQTESYVRCYPAVSPRKWRAVTEDVQIDSWREASRTAIINWKESVNG